MTVVLLCQISLCFIQLTQAQIFNDPISTITTTSANHHLQNVAPGDVVEDRQYWYSNTNNNFGGYNPQLTFNQFNPGGNWQGGYGGGGGMAYQPQQQPQWNPWQQQQMQPPSNQDASRFEASSYYYPQNQQQQLNRGEDNQQGVTPPTVSSFEALHCGHSNPTPLQISRAKRSLTFRKRKSTPATVPTVATTETAPSGSSTPTFDNAQSEERIVGGRVTNVNFWPWQISLRQGNMHFCGGSIIARHFIITAAHCFDNRSRNVNDWVVYAAKSKLRNGERGEIGPLHISSIIIHPDYGRVKPYDSDLAIIQLITPLNYSNTVYPICLPNNGNIARVGSECFVTGFGKTMRKQFHVFFILPRMYIFALI